MVKTAACQGFMHLHNIGQFYGKKLHFLPKVNIIIFTYLPHYALSGPADRIPRYIRRYVFLLISEYLVYVSVN